LTVTEDGKTLASQRQTFSMRWMRGARVGVLLRGDQFDVLADVVEHPAAVARVPGLATPLNQLYQPASISPSRGLRLAPSIGMR
jgi:hypothetical protein